MREVFALQKVVDLAEEISNLPRLLGPTGRRGQCRAHAEPPCGVSDKENEVFALQKLAD
jgi:hypothetical protein